ncbi:hypothetical protein [Nostoc sp. DSM 114160]
MLPLADAIQRCKKFLVLEVRKAIAVLELCNRVYNEIRQTKLSWHTNARN